MAEKSQATPKAADRKGESALEREADRVEKLMNSGSGSPKPQSTDDLEQGEKKLRVEQDNQVAQVKAEARAADQSGEVPEKGVNPDG